MICATVEQNKKEFFISRVLESYYIAPILFFLAFWGWFFKLTLVVVFVFCLVFALVLFFCKDVKNIFPPVLYISFFITDIVSEPQWTGYFIAIALAVIALAYFGVKSIVKDRKKLVKGKLFYPLIVASVAFLAGGISHFNGIAFLITLGFCLVNLFLYFLAVNYTRDLSKFMCFVFIAGAVILCIQVLFVHTPVKDLRPYPTDPFFSAQTVNTAAIFIFLGMAGCFGIGRGTRAEFYYFALSVVFTLGIIATCCRTMIAVALLGEVVLYVLFIIHSCRPNRFIFTVLLLFCLVVAGVMIFDELIKPVIKYIFEKNVSDLSGRRDIWNFCIEKFKERPLLGYGYIVDEDVTFIRPDYPVLLAHNTFLQWIASLGIFGTAGLGVFYFAKYKEVVCGFSRAKIFHIIALLGIGISGMMDQAAAMDFFTFLTPILIVAAAEKERQGVKKNLKQRALFQSDLKNQGEKK